MAYRIHGNDHVEVVTEAEVAIYRAFRPSILYTVMPLARGAP